MNKQDELASTGQGRKPKMLSFTFRLKPELFSRLKEKAGDIPISVIIRRLIEKYIRGEVGFD